MQIWDLFRGYEKAHGRYDIKRVNDRGKSEGRAVTYQQPLTQDLWDVHLAGTGPGVGVIPLREDDTVYWGCIDVDIYNLDLNEVEKKIREFKLPLVLCRTKSGGAHCFLFLKEPVDAKLVMDTLAGWSASLGYGGSEIFPKQSQRYDEKDIGNWLNMPYYHADYTNRYCIKDGQALELRDFLEYAESMAVTEEDLLKAPKLMARATKGEKKGTAPKEVVEDESGLFVEGPPCLQVLSAQGGFPDGTRNEGMFNVIVYLKKRYPDDWQDKVAEYNLALADPPMSLNDLNATIKSLSRKDYDYKCRKPPISAHCNRRVCQRRECGVGEGTFGAERPEILDVKKYVGDPNYWYLTINGHRLQFTTEKLLNQAAFKLTVADALGRVPRSMPQDRWDRYVDDLMRDCEIEYAPEDSTQFWQFKSLLNGYLTGQARTTTKDQLLVSLAPYITGQGEVWFKFEGLLRHLDKQGFKPPTRHQVAMWLKDESIGAVAAERSIKGKNTRVWIVPEPETLKDADEPMTFEKRQEEF